MTSMLEYQRHKGRFKKELFHRIGYTNTLYQIFRFGQILRETYQLFPVSQAILVKRIQELHPELSTAKYATGIIDVLGALNITKRVAQRVVLTYRGRALAAVIQQPWYENVKAHFFLKSVLEADGDYILNLLLLMPGVRADSEAGRTLGITFFNRLLQLLEIRKQQLISNIPTKLVREVAVKQLEAAHDSIRYDILNEGRPAKALDLQERLRRIRTGRIQNRHHGEGPTETIRHTIDPRRGWLNDLGLITRDENKTYQLTKAGASLLRIVQADGFELDGLLCVPFTKSLAQLLEISNIATVADDYFHHLAVCVYNDASAPQYSSSEKEFLKDLRFFFELTRLKRFNQAEIPALYECMVLKAANAGKKFSAASFQELLTKVLATYSDEVYQVAGRYGQAGYLSFRRRGHE